jgi:hypothetical protein
MGKLHRSVASLGFYGDDLDPSEITEQLGSPTWGRRIGETWLSPAGREKIARTGAWLLEIEDQEPADLDVQINALLDKLSNDLPSWCSLAARFKGRIFLGLFLDSSNEGIAIQPKTLARLCERGLLLDFDIYGHSAPD